MFSVVCFFAITAMSIENTMNENKIVADGNSGMISSTTVSKLERSIDYHTVPFISENVIN